MEDYSHVWDCAKPVLKGITGKVNLLSNLDEDEISNVFLNIWRKPTSFYNKESPHIVARNGFFKPYEYEGTTIDEVVNQEFTD